jgi:hypothetical protein
MIVMTLWPVATSLILIGIYEDSNIMFLVYQVVYKVLQVYQTLLVWVDIADTCQLVFLL